MSLIIHIKIANNNNLDKWMNPLRIGKKLWIIQILREMYVQLCVTLVYGQQRAISAVFLMTNSIISALCLHPKSDLFQPQRTRQQSIIHSSLFPLQREDILPFEGKLGITQIPASMTITPNSLFSCVCWSIAYDREQNGTHQECFSLMDVNEKADRNQREKNKHYQQDCKRVSLYIHRSGPPPAGHWWYIKFDELFTN